jgi:hypothetical protein
MRHLADLLAPLPLPAVEPDLPALSLDDRLLSGLGAGLPAGHLHVWGGPAGAGKTAFLLALLQGAAAHGRRVLYASYDLPRETLALRLLAMHAGVDARALAPGALPAEEARRAALARRSLEQAPFHILAARGLTVASLEDRLVRMPFRAEVLAVDYLQAVVREPGGDAGLALRDLAALATRLHVAVVCALRADPGAGQARDALDSLDSLGGLSVESADRVGWIAPAPEPGVRRAEILRNRYGARAAVPLTLDPNNGGLRA